MLFYEEYKKEAYAMANIILPQWMSNAETAMRNIEYLEGNCSLSVYKREALHQIKAALSELVTVATTAEARIEDMKAARAETHSGHIIGRDPAWAQFFQLPRLYGLGDRVEKISGSEWHGSVCGLYSTLLTPVGYVVESEREPGSAQLYPEKALRPAEGK